MKKLYIILVFLVTTSSFCIGQDWSFFTNDAIPLNTNRTKIAEAITLEDLHDRYRSDWVKKYIAVDIKGTCNGEVVTVTGDSDTINAAQKKMLSEVDFGSELIVSAKYVPENSLSVYEEYEMGFTLEVIHDKAAEFVGSEAAFAQYLEKHIIDKLPASLLDTLAESVVRFDISSTGHVENVYLEVASGHEKIDPQLLDAICDMPKWKPAEFAEGVPVKQSLIMVVGNEKGLSSCNLTFFKPEWMLEKQLELQESK